MIYSIFVGALAIATAVAQQEPPKYGAKPTSGSSDETNERTCHTTSNVPGRAFDRFITIWLENTDFDKAIGDPNLNALAKQGIALTNHFGLTHPSQPNYVGAAGADNFGMDNDNFVNIDGSVSSIIDLLEDKKISWSAYLEDLPHTGFQGEKYLNPKTKANDYVHKHNPVALYSKNDGADRLCNQKPLTAFSQDLKQRTLPQWAFITPNMTSDGHDSSVTVAGQWTMNFLKPLLQDQYFMKNTLVLITFDENHTYTSPNRVLGILLGGAVPENLKGTQDSRFYNHYSELSTVEANWGLHTLGRWDVGANVFDVVARKTGDIYRPNDAATSSHPTIFYNSSFAGPFNTGFETAAYPYPNVELVSPKTGRTVLPAIAAQFRGKKTYYTNTVVIPDGQNPPPGYKRNPV